MDAPQSVISPPGEFWSFRVVLISVALLRFATPHCERAFCLGSRVVELLLKPGRGAAQTVNDVTRPADIFQPTFYRPVRSRTKCYGSHIADLVTELDDFGVIGFLAGRRDLFPFSFFL